MTARMSLIVSIDKIVSIESFRSVHLRQLLIDESAIRYSESIMSKDPGWGRRRHAGGIRYRWWVSPLREGLSQACGVMHGGSCSVGGYFLRRDHRVMVDATRSSCHGHG